MRGAAKWKDGSAPRYASKIREPRGNLSFQSHEPKRKFPAKNFNSII